MAVQNFLEEEEYETSRSSEPRFGEPGFGRGKPKAQKGTPRARVTGIDEHYMLSLMNLTGASAEALSMVRERDETNLATTVGGMPTVKAVENRMRKLRKLGMVFSERHIGTGITSYSLTARGIDYLRSAGYDTDHADSLEGATLERLNHYRQIAQVGAMFAAGLFQDSLNIGPVPIENIVSEKAMRQATAPIKAELKKQRDDGQPGDWGPRRKLELQRAYKTAQQSGDWSQFVRTNPAVLTLPLAPLAGKKFRGVYEPDLAIVLDDERSGPRACNWLVEVELSRKSEAAYHAILQTLVDELKQPLAYAGAVFMVVGELVANRIRKVNADGRYGLIESGAVRILPITDRNGTLLPAARRITVGGESA